MAEREFPPLYLLSMFSANVPNACQPSPRRAVCPMALPGIRRRRGGAWANPVHLGAILHRKGASGARTRRLAWAFGVSVALSAALQAGPHQSAQGWLQLEQDQRAYRERVAPLDLREQRELSTIERQQRLDLQSLQQRQRWDEGLARRRPRIAPSPEVPRKPLPRDWRSDRHRAGEALRLDQQMERYRLPFGRRRP